MMNLPVVHMANNFRSEILKDFLQQSQSCCNSVYQGSLLHFQFQTARHKMQNLHVYNCADTISHPQYTRRP
jgi:penicillin-binding protein-related factor A (putative recombinase)